MLGAYPIGSIYLSVNDTSPASLFGGTWEKIQDRFLLASGSSYSLGATGGEKEHTLTWNEMPNHNHRLPIWNQGLSGTTDYGYGQGCYPDDTPGIGTWNTQAIGSAGANYPHNNMPPYLVVNVWKRIS